MCDAAAHLVDHVLPDVPVRQDPAPHVPAKLLFHVARQRFTALFAHGLEERFEVLPYDAMEHGGLGLAARIGPHHRRGGGGGRGRTGGEHGAAPSREVGRRKTPGLGCLSVHARRRRHGGGSPSATPERLAGTPATIPAAVHARLDAPRRSIRGPSARSSRSGLSRAWTRYRTATTPKPTRAGRPPAAVRRIQSTAVRRGVEAGFGAPSGA